MEVNFYDQKIEEFVDNLDDSTNSKVLRAIALLEEFGSDLRTPQSKKISHHLFELRVADKIPVRIIYTFHKSTAILLHAFIKKSDKIPLKEIWLAQAKLLALDAK